MLIVFMIAQMVLRCELWDGIMSFPFVKNAPVCLRLKEAIKEALLTVIGLSANKLMLTCLLVHISFVLA